jgi:hypothetical protein
MVQMLKPKVIVSRCAILRPATAEFGLRFKVKAVTNAEQAPDHTSAEYR